MAKPIQLFLEWEKDLHKKMLKRKLTIFAAPLPLYDNGIKYGWPFTVNEIRDEAGLPPHPDTSNGQQPSLKFPFGDISQGVTANRGAMYIGHDDVVEDETDANIPDAVIVGYWTKLLADEAAIQVGGRSVAEMKVAYPELWAAFDALQD